MRLGMTLGAWCLSLLPLGARAADDAEGTEPPGGVVHAPPLVPVPKTPAEPLKPIPVDREWDVLEPGDDLRAAFRAAGRELGDWTISVAGSDISGPVLIGLADKAKDEPFVRVVREALIQPFDLLDTLYLLDDVLAAGKAGRRGEPFYIPAGRARSNGVILHPDDVFEVNKPRNYPEKTELAVDEPPPQESFPVAKDKEILGPNWTMRYKSPTSRDEMFSTLESKRPGSTFPSRIRSLTSQLEEQGTTVYLTSFLRYRERGYLMWGAHILRSCTTETCIRSALTKLKTANVWAKVPITWSHPQGWRATQESARQMADAFDVVFATERGARYSNHYDGTAVDFVAVGLPRSLTLKAPNGESKTFDLSGAEQPRDLSLTPEVIDWIEVRFELRKLNSDHPHWDDALAL